MRVTASALTLLVAMVGVGSVPSFAPRSQAAGRRPNILIIVTDDQRADAMRYMSATKRLFRREGTSYENAFATTPVCCPARASILTGRYAHNHGVLTAGEGGRPDAERAEDTMIQGVLRSGGYRTALYGKYLNNWDLERSPKGLDDWAIFGNSAPFGYRGGIWNVNGSVRRVDRYSTKYLRRRAIGFIEAQEADDGRPWFLYVAPAAPHAPFEPEARYREATVRKWRANPAVREKDRADKPAWVQRLHNRPRKGRRIRVAQLRTLMSVDDLVGRIFKKLKSSGETRRTLAIYTSDNGFMWSEHGLGTKRWPYLQSPQIPLMLRWPGRVPAGDREDRLVANIDIAPTIADVVAVSLPNADGRSLLSGARRDRLLLEYFRSNIVNPPAWASTLTPGYQYIEYYDDNGALIGREYYDLIEDPWQLRNLLGDLDPTNDPAATDLSEIALQLREDRSCSGPEECP